MSFSLDRKALAASVRTHPGFRDLTRQIERTTMRTAVQVADERVKRRTGAYVDNFETTVTPLHGRINVLARLRLFNTRPYAAGLEKGNPPHIIRPTKPHGLLVFDYRGATVFTRKPVHHRGNKAYNIIRDALLRIASGLSA